VLIRSRSARLAALALAAAIPVVASYATPAFAAGNDADVTAVVTATNVHVTSSKGLSRVTVVFCGGDTLVADSWGGEQKVGDIVVNGVVQAVFIHSGNNTTTEAQELLADLAGADEVKGESTGEIAFHDESVCDVVTVIDDGDDDDTIIDDTVIDDTVIDDTNGGRDDNGDGDNSDPVITIASDPAPGTSVLGVTIEKPAAPAPAPALAPTAVDGSTLEVGAELPRTGSDQVHFLSGLGFALLAAGVALKGATSKRIRSASSPG
jgi:LPXTG-motif cell wall-anchored protein